MDMSGEYRIQAPRVRVWEALNDAEMLRRCIPGAERVTKTSDTEFTAEATVKVGPVKAKFGGKVTLSDIDPPNGYTITGEGQGGAAGFGKGGAKVSLTEDGGATVLHYTAEAQVGGKLAQIGSRLIQGTAKKLADDFFAAFAAAVEGDTAAADSAPGSAEAAAGEAGAEAAILEAESNPEISPAVAPLAPEAATAAPPLAPPEARSGLRPLVWIPLVVLVVLLLVVLARF